MNVPSWKASRKDLECCLKRYASASSPTPFQMVVFGGIDIAQTLAKHKSTKFVNCKLSQFFFTGPVRVVKSGARPMGNLGEETTEGSRMGQTCSKFGRPQMPSYDSPWLLCWGERMLHCNFVSFGGMTCPGIQLHKFDCSFAVREELQQDSNTNTLDGYLDAACVQVASFPDLSSNVYCTREYLEILDDRMPGLDQVPLQLQLSQSSIKASSAPPAPGGCSSTFSHRR